MVESLVAKILGLDPVCMYVGVFMALITTLVLCARSQDSLLSVSLGRVHIVFSFKGRGKPCRKIREIAALRKGSQKIPRT